MPVQVHKKGIRVLGISESFVKGESKKAVLAGVVMRGDCQIDGFGFSSITLGGMDATKGILKIFNELGRGDINVFFLNGCIISLFNIVDLNSIFESLGIPIVCVTYEESEGLDEYLEELEDSGERLEAYHRLGKRDEVILHTGHAVFVRSLGFENIGQVKGVLNRFTLQGAVPEPLKVARLLARALVREGSFQGEKKES